MSKRAIATILFCLMAATLLAAAEPVVGSIKSVQGHCSVRRGSQTGSATQGMHLQVGDLLKTGSDGRVSFIMRDGTRVSLGPETELAINQFAYDPSHDKFALILNLSRGILAYISGKIARFSPEAVRVQTPVASIGVRGTKFVVGLGVSRGTQ